MSAAAPTPSVAPAPTAPARPRTGAYRDAGAIRRERVRAARWTTSGTAKVTGDVDVGEGRFAGLLSIGGRLVADRVSADGALEVAGALDVHDALAVVGTLRASGTFHAGSVAVRGTLIASSALAVERDLRLTGVGEVPSARVGLLELDGGLTIPGEIVSRTSVRGRFRSDSALGEIRAPTVELKGPPPGLVPKLLRKVFGGAARVRVERIDAERADLEAVDVGFLRAGEIVLGAGAQVTAVEGTIVRQHPSAHVGPVSRTPPPHGLSR
ncbi:MAG TPA: hypothetical protein VEL82_02640 [Thermoplasmata archaeon]|nr:hypothetical protein [Thermoplasmata archaeon]